MIGLSLKKTNRSKVPYHLTFSISITSSAPSHAVHNRVILPHAAKEKKKKKLASVGLRVSGF